MAEKNHMQVQELARDGVLGVGTVSRALHGGDVTWQTLNGIARALGQDANSLIAPGHEPTNACSSEDLRERLRAGSWGQAPCCAYLSGDVSVLTTKRAYIVPVDATIFVSVREAARTSVDLYFPHTDGWALDEKLGRSIADGLRVHFAQPLFQSHFPWCPTSLALTIVSEVPDGVGLYEESALALALSTAIRKYCSRESDPGDWETLRLAAALLSARYTDISWATLIAANHGRERLDQVLFFDRQHDGGIDLLKLYRRIANGDDLERNLYPTNPFWTAEPVQFDYHNLTFWWSEKLKASVESRGPFSLERLPMDYVANEMEDAFSDGGGEDFYQRFGRLMQVHQILLYSARAVRGVAQHLVSRANGFPGVLGAKLACGRGSGALVILADSSFSPTNLRHYMQREGLKPLDAFRRRLDFEAR